MSISSDASLSIHSDNENEIIDLDTNRPFPRFTPPMGPSGPSLGTDMLMNKRKVSNDVMSIHSSPSASPSASDYTDEESDDYGGGGGIDYNNDMGIDNSDVMAQRLKAEKERMEAQMNEKREILYQMQRLKDKGYTLPREFTIQSDIEEMRTEYDRLKREREVDASVRFQRKMLMACVTGVEFLNERFDPFAMRLDGWSETVHDNLTDYDDIFEELHDKYKSTGKKMAPELRLMMGLSGSAFMYHLTNSMFKSQPLPGVEDVLRSDPNLMRQFQAAAMNKAAQGQGAPQQGGSSGPAGRGGQGGGLFGMIGNMFNGLGGASAPAPVPMRPPPPQAAARQQRMGPLQNQQNVRMQPMQASSQSQSQSQTKMNGPSDIESVIAAVHGDIISRPSSVANRIETMSVSDEDIASIIEETADLNGLLANDKTPRSRGGRKRTLNL